MRNPYILAAMLLMDQSFNTEQDGTLTVTNPHAEPTDLIYRNRDRRVESRIKKPDSHILKRPQYNEEEAAQRLREQRAIHKQQQAERQKKVRNV